MRRIHLPKKFITKTWGFLQVTLAVAFTIMIRNSIVSAQETTANPQLVIAFWDGGTCGDNIWRHTLEVWNVGSEGGESYASAIWSVPICSNGIPSDTSTQTEGIFSGGPDGVVVFPEWPELGCTFVDGKTVNCRAMEGAFIVQNPEAFDAIMATAITSEYIYNTYGIRVQDSFGDDHWQQTAWSDQELMLLNDVLKELPPEMIKEMAISRIIRNKVYVDEQGNQDPRFNGVYYPCSSPPEKDCNSTSGTIRIFDNALNGGPFPNDPQGIKKFKGVILHELIHALQYKKDNTSIYSNQKYSYYDGSYSPLLQNYIDAIRPVTDINDPGFNNVDNGWFYGHYPQQADQWYLLGSTGGNTPPTNYGLKNPKEDMCDSVMMYANEPQKLKDSSMQRYNFIRDQIYGGVEYENGIQKKP